MPSVVQTCRRGLRRALIVFAAGACVLITAACETLPGAGSLGRAASGSTNFAVGSEHAAQLVRGDVRALATTFVSAMNEGVSGQRYPWRSETASGVVTPGPRRAGNLREDPAELLAFRPGLFLSQEFETELGEYVLTRNANVRYGPSTDTDVVEMLQSGDGVEVVGRVVGRPWMLVAMDGEIRGFVFEDLMVRRPGVELDLAGGPTRRPHLCRTYEQSLTISGRADAWSGVACDRGDGWELSPAGAASTGPTPLY